MCFSTFLPFFPGEEPADRQTVQHRQRETPEDPSAHGKDLLQQHKIRWKGSQRGSEVKAADKSEAK